MSIVATTKMTPAGQVVIPKEVCAKLGLKAGMEFVIVGEGDLVMLKAVAPPSLEDFDRLIGEARKQARKAGLRKKDVSDSVARVRRRR